MMQHDTSGIDLKALARTIGAEYGLEIAEIAFVPKGEEAYGYRVVARDGAAFFARAQPADRAAGLEAVYAAVHALHHACGLGAALAPAPTRAGAFACRHAGYVVALFPFVEGATAYERPLTDAGLARAAELIAALHGSGRRCAVPLPARETFANPFAAPIQRALRIVATVRPANDYQRRLRERLLAEQADVLAAMARMRRLRATARRLNLTWAPTHGDPNLDNILVDARGELHLTDWGELALGPLERDLFHFTGERFALFLNCYLAAAGPARLHPALFEFYTYRWALQEIADYSARLLVHNSDPREDEHAWREIQPYLPIRHAAIAAELAEIARVLRHAAGGA